MSLEDCRDTMIRCTRCSYCKWIPFAHVKSWKFAKGCPSVDYYGFHTFSAGGRLTAALSLLESRTNYTDNVRDIVYQCQLCGLCDLSCKICRYDMDVLETLQEVRARMVKDGQVLPQHERTIKNLRKEDNMLMQPKTGSGKWADSMGLKDLTRESTTVAFFAGCRCNFDKEQQKIAQASVNVLKRADVDFGIMSNGENCCGAIAYNLGYREDFKRLATDNIKVWNAAGVKTVVTPCADCYWAFKRLYPKEANSNFEVLHTVEFIDRLIKQGKLKFSKSLPMTVTYHDPCHLGRQGEPLVPWDGTVTKVFGQITKHTPPKPRYIGSHGIYEPPRDILRAIPGLKLIEMERIKEYAWCCGAGGGVRDAYPDFSSWTASERIEEAKSTGAEALVTACPWCERNFIDVVSKDGQRMKVYDVVELVQQAI